MRQSTWHPQAFPVPATVSVTAISQADPSKIRIRDNYHSTTVALGRYLLCFDLGSDTNAGTLSAPWRHINYAASKANPGDTVQVMGGTYNEIVTIPNSGNATSGLHHFYELSRTDCNR